MRPSRRSLKTHRAPGFSLIEVVVALTLLSLAAGAMAPVALRQISGSRQKATLDKMQRIVTGLIGDPTLGDHGYIGDNGRLPDNLADLNARGTQTPYAIDATYGIGAGYNGPYVPQAGPVGAPFIDSWNSPFGYANTSAQITSAGPDRTPGTADDLIYPDADPVLTGTMNVRVEGIPNDGGPVELLGAAEVDVFFSAVVNGTRVEAQIPDSDPLFANNLPPGLLGVRVVGEGSYAGSTAQDVVEMRRGTRLASLVLEEPP